MAYRFTFTPELIRSIQAIERARAAVSLTVLPPALVEQLRLRARIRSTHYSTQIEGNRLTLIEAEQVIYAGKAFSGRERDTLEVKNYYLALEQIEAWVESGQAITDECIHKLHATIYRGRRAKPTPYRDGQNVIRDSAGGLVYLPPEAKDVPLLMGELVEWIDAGEQQLPVPIVAGIAHYQFVTIHPFYDGNGRTARALATWTLYRGGYDLGRFYALEEFYARDLNGYYAALVTHPHHNYYEGRAEADITPWLDYFLRSMMTVFEAVAAEVQTYSGHKAVGDDLLRRLDRRARTVLSLFSRQDEISSADAARVLGLSTRQARDLLTDWVGQGWLQISEASRKSRRYRLSAVYRRFIGGLSADESIRLEG
jgi:Fic family protein